MRAERRFMQVCQPFPGNSFLTFHSDQLPLLGSCDCEGHGHPKIERLVILKLTSIVGLPMVRIHDMKHPFGRQLRAVDVPLETRKVLLGHKSGDIATHYSGAELEELLEAANRICGSEFRTGRAA